MAIPVLSEILLARADTAPEAVAFESLGEAGEARVLNYAQVAARATVLAEELAGHGAGPVLVTCRTGAAYAVAVFGAFLAGRPMIPAYPRGTSSHDEARLDRIVADARPAVTVAEEDPDAGQPTPGTLTVPGAEADGTAWGRPAAAGESRVAIIQYTSGSTGRPRGVLVSHESLAANTAAIAERFGLDPESRALTWLPMFHDMGLVGGLLTPVAAGIPVRVLAPGDFLKSPLSWLRQIHESGATVSGAPNFAYELCVRRIRRPEQLDGLDLSRWRVAFTGGEPVRARTLAEFAEKLSPTGFRAGSFLPCYGLAEATLIVSGGFWSGRTADDAAVACGTPVAGQQVAVVDPGRRVRTDGEGEIWISGPHVTDGYLSGDSAELFGELDGVRYLRSGDLGRWRDGELVPTGRVKDVIVFRGVNHHAADIEAAAVEAAGRAGHTAAAFAVDTGTGTLPVLVLEAGGRPGEAFAARIRAAVLERTGLRLAVVAVVPPRSVPRTSSGKVRRSACREAWLAGAFGDAACAGDAAGSRRGPGNAPPLAGVATARLTELIRGVAAEVCEAGGCGPEDPFFDLGMDSVRAAETAAVLEHALGLSVPFEVLLGTNSPRGAALGLVSAWAGQGLAAARVLEQIRSAESGGVA